MEADKNGIGEDVTGHTTNFQCQSETNRDFVDALPDSHTNPGVPKSKDESKIYVHQYKDDTHYNTNHSSRGLAVIFNHENFNSGLHLPKRVGTKVDCDNLKTTLSNINFEVVIHEDLYVKQIEAVLDELAATDFKDCDCLLILVLSHGGLNTVYARNSVYSTNILFERFTPDKCRTLAGKPKIFILQTCQGDRLDSGVEVECDSLDSGSSYRLPLFADFLFAYSTIPGYYSWRNTSRGSWFIESLCAELNLHWKKYDLVTILTFVNRRVAVDFISKNDKIGEEWKNDRKQTSTFTSQLTRLLRFYPKIVENNGNIS